MENFIDIDGRKIGDGYPCYIIAEVSANHGGKLDNALKMIKVAKNFGADCVKIQTYTADTLTLNSKKKYFEIDKGTWKGENLYNLYEKAFTPWEWHEPLKNETEKLGMKFLSTAYDKSSVDFLEELDVNAYKIASFELNDIPLIDYIASKDKPIIISTGMGSLGEIEEAVNTIKAKNNNKICLLKCSSAYPAIPEDMNLKTIKNLKQTFNVPVGLSDHTIGNVSAITAIALGANVIEKHFCLDRKIITPDSSFSMEPEEFKKMVNDIRIAEKCIGNISYSLSDKEKVSKIYRKSIFTSKNIKKGEIFSTKNIKIIRPANGLHPRHFNEILGKIARIDIEECTPLDWNMIN